MLELLLALQAVSPPMAEERIVIPQVPIDTVTVIGRVPVLASPATVTKLDLSEIGAEQAVLDLADVLTLVPGVQVARTGPLGAQASVFVRGTDSDHVLATYDGIRLNSPATPNGLYSFGSDLLTEGHKAEVLRGPGSATFGSDAIGGVVNLVPDHSHGGAASLSVGELGTVQGSAYTASDAGGLSFVVGGAYQRTDGWDALPGRIVPEERRGERDGSEGFLAHADLDYAVGRTVALSLTALHREAEAEFDTFSGGPTGFQRADGDLASTDRLSVLRGGVTYAPGAWSVTANVGLVDAGFRETSGAAVTGDVRGERVFAEVLGRFDRDAMTLSTGLIYEDERADIPVSFSDPLDVSEDHVGGFVFGQAEAPGGVTLRGAVRADDYEAFGAAVTWSFGASWRTGGLALRASAGTAFNAPSLAERFSTSAFNQGNPDLSEETAFAAELGAAYRLRAGPGHLTAEAILFRTDTDALIEYDFATLSNRNVGDARAQGAELSLRWEGNTLSAFAAYTFTDAENQDTGTPLLRRPEHGLTARVAWQVNDDLSVSGRYVHTGARPDVLYDDQGFFGGTGETDGFGLAALTARYALTDGLGVFVAATNVLDETYEEANGFGGAPRQLRAGVRARW